MRRTAHYCANAVHGGVTGLRRRAEISVARANSTATPQLVLGRQSGSLRELELAKKRLIYSLLRFHLPLDGSVSVPQEPAFDFVQNATTGHLDGVVTINVSEADAVERERQRQQFQEPYRSLLGHLRHESGHYYWPLLVEQGGALEQFRELFGDEREDYAAALARHHESGPLSGLAAPSSDGLRQHASLGRLGRDLGALSAHGRSARYR